MITKLRFISCQAAVCKIHKDCTSQYDCIYYKQQLYEINDFFGTKTGRYIRTLLGGSRLPLRTEERNYNNCVFGGTFGSARNGTFTCPKH